MESCAGYKVYVASLRHCCGLGRDRESGDSRLQFVRKLFSNWVKLVPNKKTKTMCTRNNKAIWRIMEHANKSVFSCCWLAAGRGCFQLHDIENWPESSHKITVLDHRLGIWRKYSEFQVWHLHKQSPPITNHHIVSNCQTAHFANGQACPWRKRGLQYRYNAKNWCLTTLVQ